MIKVHNQVLSHDGTFNTDTLWFKNVYIYYDEEEETYYMDLDECSISSVYTQYPTNIDAVKEKFLEEIKGK